MSHLMEFLTIYVDRLDRAVKAGENPIIRFSDVESGEIVLSFDRKYRPFIPSNLGYNQPDERIRIRECKLTRELGLDLQKVRIDLNDMSGGRVFIRKDGSFIKLKDGTQLKVSNINLKN